MFEEEDLFLEMSGKSDGGVASFNSSTCFISIFSSLREGEGALSLLIPFKNDFFLSLWFSKLSSLTFYTLDAG